MKHTSTSLYSKIFKQILLMEAPKGQTKQQAIDLFNQGFTVGEVSKKLGKHYSQIHTIHKNWKSEQKSVVKSNVKKDIQPQQELPQTGEVQPTQPVEFEINERYLSQVNELVAKINKHAAKHNFPPVQLQVGQSFRVSLGKQPGSDFETFTSHVKITVIAGQTGIKGWQFLGTLDHMSVPGEVFAKEVPGKSIPTHLRNSPPICHKCGYERIRKETFVVQNEKSGEYKLVGRNCLKDFFGYDVSAFVKNLEGVGDLIEEIEKLQRDRNRDYGPNVRPSWDATVTLAISFAVIAKEGWVKASSTTGFDYDPSDTKIPTYSQVLDVLEPDRVLRSLRKEKDKQDFLQWIDSLDVNNEKWNSIAKDAFDWISKQPSGETYIENLQKIARANIVNEKTIRFWVSLAATYNKYIGKTQSNKFSIAPGFYGNVGDKIKNVPVKIINATGFSSMYGSGTRISMQEQQSQKMLVWFGAGQVDVQKDQELVIKSAIIKKHSNFNGTEQTLIKNVKFV